MDAEGLIASERPRLFGIAYRMLGEAGEAEDAVQEAFLRWVVLERLSPLERAAFLLHDVFGYTHDEVAAMLERTPAAVRQVATRARGHLAAERPRYERDAARRKAVTRGVHGCRHGCRPRCPDGGARARRGLRLRRRWHRDGCTPPPARRRPRRAGRPVAGMAASCRLGLRAHELNGEPGLTIHRADGTIDSAWILHAVDGRIVRIDVLRNPAKLAGLDAGG